MARVGLVLGGGGVAGGSWHAAALSALAAATGWDARDAAVVVGTSAGSIAGGLLRAGVSPDDLYAGAVGARLSPDGARIQARVSTSPGALAGRRIPGRAAPANPRLLGALAPSLRRATTTAPWPPSEWFPWRPQWERRPGVALAGLLPEGAVDGAFIGARVEEALGGLAWPTEPLWVVAVRLADGRRVVFGHDEVDARLGEAVSASSAVPGLFAPVSIGGTRYVDGGVHSTTNADLLAGAGLDLVVVSAPMAGTWRALRPHPAALSRSSARVAVDREAAALRRAGTRVLVLQPGPQDTPLMDGRAMDPSARKPIAEQARRSLDRYLSGLEPGILAELA
jgi:NTE family protein